jgi:protein-S-isoprenylcysteine O-methyltransferase Ste14
VKVIFGEDKGPVLELTGIHTYVRHPLYLGTLATLWSVFLFFPLLNNLIACLAITVYTLIGIRLEERKLLRIFGRQYADYRRHTPMLIPSFRLR